ncbi:glycosyl transferase family 2 [Thermodesulfobium narugense DSM 14796]|uniref:Glycosyl transferase family 2 n=1 Tax=Thermodesulfobium narugense DSM 14796 TaxID=747365 RepID=M1E555_9BACT|nr:glycosyltransferase family 2 protein [Thermodesulfobium narugense]AEE14046.1 glycosyl transferase family 2 [Thermodesulfobium narugense DSM 14796]
MNRETTLAIVIPVYNEGNNILKTLREINGKIRSYNKIYIIYDFDEDTTLKALESVSLNDYKVSLLKNKYGKGALNAIKTGIEESTEDAVLVVMADLSDDLSVADRMFDLIKDGYDVVCGSRYMKGGAQFGGPKLKGLLSRLAGISLHYLTGIPTHDVTNSFKMYSRNALKKINIESTGGFEIGMEITVKTFLSGGKITEVPSTWKDRSEGKSNFKLFRWLPKYIKWYLYAVLKRYF